jgi:hypothetical protein
LTSSRRIVLSVTPCLSAIRLDYPCRARRADRWITCDVCEARRLAEGAERIDADAWRSLTRTERAVSVGTWWLLAAYRVRVEEPAPLR